MILADKITEMRKKNGWSQEELADQLEVSRQSVSKWESAQSVPDMNKILRLSELFGVSTDYLLKDEMEAPEGTRPMPVEAEPEGIRVSMEEASSFLEFRNVSSFRVPLGVMLCILSPVLLILLAGLQEMGRIGMSENQAVGIGAAVLLAMVVAAVALFVLTSIQGKRYEYLEKEPIDTEYGVDGMARERMKQIRPDYTRHLTAGIVLCAAAAIPIFLSMAVFDSGNSFPYLAAVGAMLVLVGFGVFLIVRSCMIWEALNMLVEEGDYSRRNKEEERRNAPIAGIYWSVVLAVYFAYSFITRRWDQSWIVWPIAGVLYGAVTGILKLKRSRA